MASAIVVDALPVDELDAVLAGAVDEASARTAAAIGDGEGRLADEFADYTQRLRRLWAAIRRRPKIERKKSALRALQRLSSEAPHPLDEDLLFSARSIDDIEEGR